MELLVLGGSRFVGRAVVLEALARGWTVTALNRGISGPLPTEVEQLVLDRTDPAALADALRDRHFDLAVDTWSGAPKDVQAAAELLVGKADRFHYVSSISVYTDGRPPGGTEAWPVVDGEAGAASTDYAADKRGGELAALAAFPDAVLARAGLILGPWENVGRLPWWLGRCHRGGRVVAPGRPDRPIQCIDVRDLAAWLLDALASDITGPVDLVCPSGLVTMQRLLQACVAATGDKAELVWVDQETVLASGAEPWTQLPCWVPEGGEYDGFMESDTSAAIATGLRNRPFEDTARDAWAWLQAEGLPVTPPERAAHGLPPDIEAALLGSTVSG